MPRLQDLASRSLTRWQLDQQVAERFWRDEIARPMRWDVITMSREVGSGGATVAKLVAQQLGFKLWDREILEAMAERLKAEIRHVEAMDEQVPSALENLLRSALVRMPTTATYKRILKELMQEIADRGKVVILGRGAAILLPQSMRVRIIAPLEVRVARVAELEGLTEAVARRSVTAIDGRRLAFGHVHFRRDLDSPVLYDLVISTERTSLEHAAAQVVFGATQRRRALEEGAPRQ